MHCMIRKNMIVLSIIFEKIIIGPPSWLSSYDHKKAAATYVRYWELFRTSYWELSIFFYLAHKTNHKNQTKNEKNEAPQELMPTFSWSVYVSI